MRLLVTGGTGFFGKALLRFWGFQASGDGEGRQVTVLSRNPDQFQEEHRELTTVPWLRFVRGDIMEPATLSEASAALEGTTHVLHAATDSTRGLKLSPLQRFDQILTGTRHILDLTVRIGARRFLLCSSGGVYGAPPTGVFQFEESYHGVPDPLLPNNAYSIGKRAAEHLCSLYAAQYGLEVVVARCFAFVGRDLPIDAHFAIGNFIRDAIYRSTITVAGDGTAVRSYLDQRDLARWLTVMLERGSAGRAYNVGSDKAINMSDLARLVRDVLSPQKRIEILGAASSNENRNFYVPSIERARRELGLDVLIPLQRAIQDAAMTRVGTVHRD